MRADAAESAVCGYLSIIALVGLVVHAIWHIEWADPIAALAITPLIVYEAREAIRGKACGCRAVVCVQGDPATQLLLVQV